MRCSAPVKQRVDTGPTRGVKRRNQPVTAPKASLILLARGILLNDKLEKESVRQTFGMNSFELGRPDFHSSAWPEWYHTVAFS